MTGLSYDDANGEDRIVAATDRTVVWNLVIHRDATKEVIITARTLPDGKVIICRDGVTTLH